jgi:hypothetical protein
LQKARDAIAKAKVGTPSAAPFVLSAARILLTELQGRVPHLRKGILTRISLFGSVISCPRNLTAPVRFTNAVRFGGVRTAFHNARKRTPPKVNQVPYFPMIQETTVRKGFLTHLLQFAMEVVAWHSIDGGRENWGHYGREKGTSDVVTLWPSLRGYEFVLTLVSAGYHMPLPYGNFELPCGNHDLHHRH